MTCPRCRHPNRDEAAFCAECGAALAAACAGCGAPSPAGAKFCDACGRPAAAPTGGPGRTPRAYTPPHLVDRILATRSALEGERKQVTVLFADVKGSMELAAQVDAEEWHRIMDRFFTILAEGVHRFEGTVNQFTGDGIMALFGAPVAHEDHAPRACHAALHLAEALRRYAAELRRSRGLNFTVRLGLDSGEVVVGKIGDDLRMDSTALGQTVGRAARVEQLAEAGCIYVSEQTARLAAGLFCLRDLGEFTVKGIPSALRLYELEGVGTLRTRLDVSRARGFSRFVGREAEAATLEAALTRALAGAGQVVGVVAEPGAGKSRLCHEFAERCRARGLAVTEARAVPHGRTVPLVPVLEYVRGYFGIAGQEPPQAAREKVAGKLLLLDPDLVDALPLLFDVLGIADPDGASPRPAAEQQRSLLATLHRLVRAQGEREAAVSLIEDLHWLDEASEPFVEGLVDAAGATRMLLLLNFRPGYRAAWMQRSWYRELSLQPLGPEAVAEMLRELLGTDPSVEDVAPSIGERAAGNPFFVEEIVQALAEGGALVGRKGAYRATASAFAAALPATVQAALAGRIDRLTAREKQVLHTAAVIGREFPEPILRRVAELPEVELAEALRTLVAAEFLHPTTLEPERAYAFKHPLTQEVAYHVQLGDQRARLHGAAAAALQELRADQLGEYAALIGHHWEAAGRRFEAARWRRRAALRVSSIRVAVLRPMRNG